MKALLNILGIIVSPFLFALIILYIIGVVIEIEIRELLAKKKMEDPEETSWEDAETNPQLELAFTSDTSTVHREEETQPYRRPTYLDEIQSWSD